MDSVQIIEILHESIQRDFGDYGRTNYIIERLEKGLSLPKSDLRYIDRMIDKCKAVITIKESEKSSEFKISKDLIKCNYCNNEINLDEKTIRRKDFWFHEQCFSKIPIIEHQISQEPRAPTKIERQSIKRIEKKESKSQMIFSGGLIVALVGTTYLAAGEIIATIVGIFSSITYFGVYKSQIVSKKVPDKEILKTGIPGFDSILSEGLKKNSSIIVSGPPGSGKTIFGLQFIYSGAKDYDEPGVYISLSQSIEEIKHDCESFGWDIDKQIEKGKILMVDLRPFKIKDEVIGKEESLYRGEQIPFEHLTKFILNSIKKINAKRIVIDSISILGMQYADKFYMRQGLQGMIQSLENFKITSLLISEATETKDSPPEWFVTSGIIHLNNQFVGNQMKRTIRITKLRGIKHSEKVHSIELGKDGLCIYEG